MLSHADFIITVCSRLLICMPTQKINPTLYVVAADAEE
jgi:hypothetical protein